MQSLSYSTMNDIFHAKLSTIHNACGKFSTLYFTFLFLLLRRHSRHPDTLKRMYQITLQMNS
jgi:hypothetical protein